ncbi:PREDICTED: uncharacterized protein K02A2.6-like [Trachymyrmex cornetzi]|uniref:uncharacterized protein K02A2.6-like n=1 Tax=Trachymyrmex cornetzi TaxID=471704 RepID=UPI00084F67D0|nr:PREDICTED: uncharacterized protein K02A2.6-like [Trachymyrmex cornetzi]
MDATQFQRIIELINYNQQQLLNQVASSRQQPAINATLLPSFENFDPKKESFRYYRQRFENYLQMKGIATDKTYFYVLNSLEALVLEASKIDSRELSKNQPSLNTANHTEDVKKVTRQRKSRRDNSTSNHKFSAKSPGRYKNNKTRSKSKIDYRQLGIEGLCLRCGNSNHIAKDCRTNKSTLKCTACDKTGHLSKVCIRSLLNNNEANTSNTKSTNCIREEISAYGVNHIIDIYENQGSERDKSKKYFTTVVIEGQPQTFEVDSGAGVTLLPRKEFKKLNLSNKPRTSTIAFRSYSNNVFLPDGEIKVEVCYKDKVSFEKMYIVPDNMSPLLGRSWIRNLNINLQEIDKELGANTIDPQIPAINNIENIINHFPDIFEEKIGCVPEFLISLQLREGAKPIFHKGREIPYALREKVEKELDDLEAAGIISKVTLSDWGSPLVVIPKTDGGVRLCVDYKMGVNQRLISANYPIQRIDEILNSLRDSRFFCRLDLFKAYLHLKVDKESSEIQTISTHRGTYRMNRLSFGIKTAPSEFNRIIDQILSGLNKTLSYFDDIIVHGSTKEECQENLYACLQRLKKYDLHLNRRKCSFFQEEIEYLGHTIGFNKISKSPKKVEAIVNMTRPSTADDVRRFLGMVTYYSRFIPDASTITYPLRKLLVKDSTFKWTKACEGAFLKLKNEISSDRILTPYNPKSTLVVTCDASPTGIAGILSHVLNGIEKPIAFASRSLTPAERNYSQLDREALVIVFAINHFFMYVFGRKFKLITDNRPLTRIFHQNNKLPAMTSARLLRYASFLSGFDYEVEHKKGNENINADCLSRAPIHQRYYSTDIAINEEVHQLCYSTIFEISTEELTTEKIIQETDKDEVLSKIKQALRNGEADNIEYTLEAGIIFKGQRAVIPKGLQSKILEELHKTHVDITKMKQLARRYYIWKGIDRDIENTVRSRQKWAEIRIIKEAPTSEKTIDLLKDIFSTHGFPKVMVSDNATIFVSKTFKHFCHRSGIFQKLIAPGHPATNGLAERNVQTLKQRLKSMQEESLTLTQKVREILFKYRATPLACGKSPAELYLQRNFRIKLDILKQMKNIVNYKRIPGTRNIPLGGRVQARYFTNQKPVWKFGTVIRKFGQLHYLIKLDSGLTDIASLTILA